MVSNNLISRFPFQGSSNSELIQEILYKKVQLKTWLDPLDQEIILSLLNKDPSQRSHSLSLRKRL